MGRGCVHGGKLEDGAGTSSGSTQTRQHELCGDGVAENFTAFIVQLPKPTNPVSQVKKSPRQHLQPLGFETLKLSLEFK